MTEAMFYKKKENQSVLCCLCPHNCTIQAGNTGYCGVRKNIDGILTALTYGKIISAAVDPVEKKPLYHFYPGSSAFSLGGFGCNLACKHCQNYSISQVRDQTAFASLYDMAPDEIVKKALEDHCETIAWTYNEPTIWYEYILETALIARSTGIKTALITNGVINDMPLEDLLPHLDAYRVDIKGFTDEFYKELTGFPFLKQVLHNAETAYNRGCHVEIVTNVIEGRNDSEEHIDGIIDWIGSKLDETVPWHVTAYHRAYRLQDNSTSAETLEKIYKRGQKKGLKHIYLGNVYSSLGRDTFCPECGELLISRRTMAMEENRLAGKGCPICRYELKNYRGNLSSR